MLKCQKTCKYSILLGILRILHFWWNIFWNINYSRYIKTINILLVYGSTDVISFPEILIKSLGKVSIHFGNNTLLEKSHYLVQHPICQPTLYVKSGEKEKRYRFENISTPYMSNRQNKTLPIWKNLNTLYVKSAYLTSEFQVQKLKILISKRLFWYLREYASYESFVFAE